MSEFNNGGMNNDEMNNDGMNNGGMNNNFNNGDGKKPKKSKKAVAGILTLALGTSILGGVVGGTGVYAVLNDRDDDSNSIKTESSSTPQTKVVGTSTAGSTAAIVEKVAPAVVGVSTKSMNQANAFFGGQEQEGIGSGFIIDKDGSVITNYHVIEGANEVKVILSTGEEVAAKVVNYDAKEDIALLKITDKNVKLPGVAELGDSLAVTSGEDVIAIGNPLGKEFSSTVTKGIVSSANRQISVDGSKENVVNYIQTDAAINPGNSGGPLINSQGQVIGINTAKKVGEEIEGIGFAIPINKVKDKLTTLSQPVIKLGISARNVDANTAKAETEKGNKIEEGIYVLEVEPFSSAENAGIRPKDLITSFGGKKVKTVEELNKAKESHKINDTVKVGLIRDGKKITVDMKLTES